MKSQNNEAEELNEPPIISELPEEKPKSKKSTTKLKAEKQTEPVSENSEVEPKSAFYVDPNVMAEFKKAGEGILNTEEDIKRQPLNTRFIDGGKILKNGVEIFFTKSTAEDKGIEVNEKHNAAPHKDLVAAFSKLKVHLACLAGYILPSEITSISKVTKEQVERFTVTGFSIKGGDQYDGFSLSGSQQNQYGRTGLNTPFVRNTDDTEEGYIFIVDLFKSIKKCQAEMLLYLDGKHAPEPQQSIEFPAGEDA